jgi:hypothetical protein
VAGLESSRKRRSERVHVRLQLNVRGIDAAGAAFVEQAHTVQVNRGGAVIRIQRQLAPGAKLVLARPGTEGQPEEAAVRIVDRMGSDPDGERYSVAFEGSGTRLWGISFSHPAGNAEAIVRLLLECSRCDGREVAWLDGMQLQDLESARMVARACSTCGAPTLWRHAPEELSESRPPATPPASPSPADKRKKRIASRVNVCLRRAGSVDEVAVCEDLSVGGLCFRSRKRFAKGERVEVAVPYIKGISNIFVPARIVHVTEVPEGGIYRHGAAYLRAPEEASHESSEPDG